MNYNCGMALGLLLSRKPTTQPYILTMNSAYSYKILDTDSGLNSYQISEENNELSKRFEIHALEWMETQLSLSSGPEKLSRFEIFWIKKGRGILCVDEQSFEVSDNNIYCLAPGSIRKYDFETSIEGYYISFAPEFVWLSEGYASHSSWLVRYDDSFKAAAIKIDTETDHELEVVVRKMKWEFSNYFNRRLELLKGLLNIFLIYFSRNLKESVRDLNQNKESELVKNFMGLLKKNFINQKMVSDYARLLYVTPNYLNRTVKKVTGFTASHHIQQQIILEAKRKAIYSSISMKEIAYQLGFDNLAHFSKFFKNNCGVNFTDYKKQALRAE